MEGILMRDEYTIFGAHIFCPMLQCGPTGDRRDQGITGSREMRTTDSESIVQNDDHDVNYH